MPTSRPNGHRIVGLVAALSLIVAGSCSDGKATAPDLPSANTPEATTPSAITPSTITPSATPSTRPPDGTDASTTTGPSPSACDADRASMMAVVEDSIAAARLDPGGAWSVDTQTSAFDDRTHMADEFAYRTGLDCTERLTQSTPGGDDRLVLAAWTGERRAWVVQASDPPAEAYRAEQRVQLFIDQPLGEWLVNQALWAGSLATGETVIVGVTDAPFGPAAKAWWAEVPRFDDLRVSNDAERYAMDVLVAAGARNVSVAEPASFGSEVGAIQFITPLGLHLVATAAPLDWFDPTAPIVDGDMVVERIGGVDVYVTTASATSYAVGSVGWTCGDFVWFIDSSYGTVNELVDWVRQLIETAGC
jgi:hypothetical protein